MMEKMLECCTLMNMPDKPCTVEGSRLVEDSRRVKDSRQVEDSYN